MWWEVEYFHKLWALPDIQLYFNNLRFGDPCFVNAEYLVEHQNVLNDFCKALVPLEQEWNTSAVTAMDILQEVKHFANDCKCSFPNHYTSRWRQNMSDTDVANMGFTELELCEGQRGVYDRSQCKLKSSDDAVCNLTLIFVFPGTILTLNETNLVYHGNTSICTNKTAALKLLLEAPAPEHEDRDWYELWIASGFLSTLLVKIAAANFGLSLTT